MRSVIFCSVAALLSGCAATPLPEPPPADPGPPLLGLARVVVRSDVAIIPDEVQHVIYPSRAAVPVDVRAQLATVKTLPAQPRTPPIPPAVNVSHQTSQSTTANPVKLATVTPSKPSTRSDAAPVPPSPSDADVLKAWLKYCKADQEISSADWQIIDTKPVPADVAARWSQDCIPSK